MESGNRPDCWHCDKTKSIAVGHKWCDMEQIPISCKDTESNSDRARRCLCYLRKEG
jgi:hypothetical protein